MKLPNGTLMGSKLNTASSGEKDANNSDRLTVSAVAKSTSLLLSEMI
jgi:hypothetical protein